MPNLTMLNGRDPDQSDPALSLTGFSSIIHEILDIASRTLVCAEQLERIIGCLTERSGWDFPSAGCATVPSGLCHWGQTFQCRKLTFFTDNGQGMRREMMDKVFEPFFTTKKSGTWLGMSIAYRVLREKHAAIAVESQEGEGSAFTIFFQIISPA